MFYLYKFTVYAHKEKHLKRLVEWLKGVVAKDCQPV